MCSIIRILRSHETFYRPTKRPPQVQNNPPPALVEPPPPAPVAQEAAPEAQEPTREEPTTVEAPTWDDEPVALQPPATQPTLEQLTTTDGWVDANLTSTKSERTESWTDLGSSDLKTDSGSWKNTIEPSQPMETVAPAQQQQEPQPPTPQVQKSKPSSFSPPPGLANPALSGSPAAKHAAPSNSRPALGTYRPNSRFKTDQAVTMLPSSQGGAGFSISKPLPLQFGSLSLSGDETHPLGDIVASDQQHIVPEQKQVYGNGQPSPSPSMSHKPADTLTASQVQPTSSPSNAYRLQTQQQQPRSQPQQEESQSVTNADAFSNPAHTQGPSINPSLAIPPGPGPALAAHQHTPATTHHTIAGLTHAPQHPAPQGLGHSHHPSFGQQVSFPPQQQQQYDGTTTAVTPVSGPPFSGLGQSPQGQSQFFRQTDSPFYNQTHTPLGEHGFGGGSAGFGQGMQTGFGGGPGLGSDFGYDSQRVSRPSPWLTFILPTKRDRTRTTATLHRMRLLHADPCAKTMRKVLVLHLDRVSHHIMAMPSLTPLPVSRPEVKAKASTLG